MGSVPDDATALTRADAPAALAKATPFERTSSVSQVSTPAEALYLDEIQRIRAFTVFVIALAVVVPTGVFSLSGDPLAKKIFTAGCSVALIGSIWVRWKIRDADRYRPRDSLVFGMGCVIAVVCGIYYFGPYSAVVLVIPLGAFLFSLGQELRASLLLIVSVGIPHVVLGVLIAFDVIKDVGVIRADLTTTVDKLVYVTLIQFVIFAAFTMGRIIRREKFRSLEQLDAAVRQVAQREALLDEAKQELERALKVGGPGRFTDQRVGSFRLGHLIGRGAMGEVYEATHVETSESAAVKLLTASALRDPKATERFFRELEVAGALEAPNIVRVLEVAGADSSVPYLAMEHLRGETLSDILRRERRLPLDRVADLVVDVATGAGEAHAVGVVHRDLKPGNLFLHQHLSEPAVWKILDFGVSKLADSQGTLTQGSVIGTPGYMAPEQARGDPVDARADIYALGIIAYRALTGQPAFSGKDIVSILYKVVHSMPVRPSELVSLPEEVELVLAIAMAKNADDRFADALSLSEALRDAVDGELSVRLRDHAQKILETSPWGTENRMVSVAR